VAVLGFVVTRRDMMAAASVSGEANHDRIAFVETLAHQHHACPPAGHPHPSSKFGMVGRRPLM
jgi:hypothetical protein